MALLLFVSSALPALSEPVRRNRTASANKTTETTTLITSATTSAAKTASTLDTVSLPLRVTLNLQEIELRELVRILGQQAGVTIYADPSVKGTASINVENLPFESALKAILEPRGYVLQKFLIDGETDAARYFVYDPSSARRIFIESKNGRLTVDIQRFQLVDVLAEIARESKRSIVPVGDVSTPLTLSLQDIPFDLAIEEIALSGGCQLAIVGKGDTAVYRIISDVARDTTPMAATAFQRPFEISMLEGGKIRLRATDAPIKDVMMAVGEAAGLSLSIDADVIGSATLYLDSVAPDESIRALATQARLRALSEENVIVITKADADRLSVHVVDGRTRVDAYDAPIREALTRIALAGGLPALTFDPSVEGTISIHLADLSPRSALAKMAEARGLRLDERGEMIRITDPLKEKRIRIIQQAGLVTFDIQNATLSEVLLEFGVRTSVNVSAPRADTLVTISIQSLPVPASLRVLAEAVGLGVIEEVDRFRLAPPGAAPRGIAKVEVSEGFLSIDCADAEIALIAKHLAEASGKNFLIETGVTGAISGTIENVVFEPGLKTFLASKGYRLRKSNGIYRISSGSAPAAGAQEAAPNLEIQYENGRLSLDVTDADLGALLRQIAEEAHYDIALYGAVRDKVNIVLRNEALEPALAKILAGTRFGYTLGDSMLTVGDISQPGPMSALALREEIMPLQYFSAKEVPALLPAEIPGAQVKVIEAQNALLISGRPEIIEKARRFLAILDQKPTQIQIEGLLVEYRTTDAFTYNLSSLLVTGQTPDVAQVQPSSGAGSFTVTDLKNFHNPQFQFSLTALVEKGDASIRARPSIATVTGREAKINVQSQENFRVTQPSSTQGVPLVQIQSINSGITLRITPYVSADAGDAVTIDIFFEDSSPGDRTADGLPAIATRNAQNRIVLKSDRTAVIGGLIRNDVTHSRGGFPILSNLPIVGSLFGRSLRSDRQSTLVFYITPRIIKTDTSVAQTFSDRGVIVDPEALPPHPIAIPIPSEQPAAPAQPIAPAGHGNAYSI